LLAETWVLEYSSAITFAFAGFAAVTDAETGHIPDRLVLVALAPIVLVLCLDVMGGDAGAVRGAVIGLAAFAGPLLIVHLASPVAMGFGDVKLAATLGASLGVIDPRSAVLALCIACAVTAAVGVARRRSAVPFGPGLVLGAALSLVVLAPALGGRAPWR